MPRGANGDVGGTRHTLTNVPGRPPSRPNTAQKHRPMVAVRSQGQFARPSRRCDAYASIRRVQCATNSALAASPCIDSDLGEVPPERRCG